MQILIEKGEINNWEVYFLFFASFTSKKARVGPRQQKKK